MGNWINEKEEYKPGSIITKNIPTSLSLQQAQDKSINLSTAVKNSRYSRLIWKTVTGFHNHKFWEICLVLKGKARHHFPDRIEEMVAGQIYILRPHDVHYIEPLDNSVSDFTSNYAHRDIYVKEEKMKRLLNALDSTLYDRLFNADAPISAIIPLAYVRQIDSMLNFFCMNEEDFDFMHSVIISHILSCTLEQINYKKRDLPDWLNNLITNLNREEFMTKNISEIISTIGYTQSYICRQFKKYMGITLVKYIQQIKCHYSLSLLTDSNILEKDIAYKLNFSDESAYINIFKKIYKITPGQWRKSLKHSKESLNI